MARMWGEGLEIFYYLMNVDPGDISLSEMKFSDDITVKAVSEIIQILEG